jgi:hypothetical protein
MLARPPSLPTPLALYPPSSNSIVRLAQALTEIRPASRFLATRSGRVDVPAPHARARPVFGVVGQRDGLFLGVEDLYRLHRAERLLLHDRQRRIGHRQQVVEGTPG